MLTSALLLLLAQMPIDTRAGENELTTIRVDAHRDNAGLQWRDAEDVVHGNITPWPVRAGAPFTVSVSVGTVAGDFEGPVTLGLRPLEALGGTDSATVSASPGERMWVHTFTPTQAGPHRLDVSFSSTRAKSAQALITVEPAALPAWVSYATGTSLVGIALTVGLWLLATRKKEAP